MGSFSFNFSLYFLLLKVLAFMTSSAEPTALSTGVSTFAIDFYAECVKSKPGNVIVSPLSVATSLALLLQATGGSTFQELKNGLHFTRSKAALGDQFHAFSNQLKNSVGDSTLSIANQIYIKQGLELNKNFQEVAATKFNSGVESLNLDDSAKSAETINHFIDEKTNGNIKTLVKSSDLNADTAVFLVNAIYFKGNWEIQFNKNDTHEGEFYINESESISTDFMFKRGEFFNYAYLKDLNASALEMKYANSKLSFVMVLPRSRTGLAEMEAKLKDYSLAKVAREMKSRKIDVFVPKFKVDYDIELNDVLQSLGMATMFSDSADLSGLLASNEQTKVSKVIHKAVIEVNEEGSEAAATTGIKIQTKKASSKFKADHPFMYFIRDTQSDTIIFSGRIVNFDKK